MHTAAQGVIFNLGIGHLPPLADEQHVARGRAARKATPRSTHAALDVHGRSDPIALLEEQARSRVPELVPIRHGRMMESPFTFFRGAALIMASDLARTPTSGLRTQLCGDAHLLNFGVFGTPERELIFDVNDFDETTPGPWEWDLKRLAASLEIAGRDVGFSRRERRDIVLDAVRCYREALAEFAAMPNLDVWYARLAMDTLLTGYSKQLTPRQMKTASRLIATAMKQNSLRELGKLTRIVDGEHHIVSRPPAIVPIHELIPKSATHFDDALKVMIRDYRTSLQNDRRVLLDQYHFVEAARKVVGVGSVGTRCWIVLLIGVHDRDPLFLQVKEAERSVLERFLEPGQYQNQGERVVSGQRLMQAASDILLGWIRTTGLDGVQRDFYLRQLRDWKGSFSIEDARPSGMSLYGAMCAWTLARAHARSGDRVAIASYLGRTERFDQAIATFASTYADQSERDYDALLRAIRSGRLAAERGV